ncbi:MAG: phosphatidylcholine/phosphatidylserine synthase [Spirochaetales bacterium]|jgi:CDP-diacylglycerol--serine O-phosphatidyltransferase|nr:phosphatidylcholine/phosphatidylserine synthase [Spirochaetales bacterium]
MAKEKRFGRRRSPQPGRVKKMRLKYIAILPSLITLMNAICGFIAIVYASRGSSAEVLIFHLPGFTLFALSGYMIFLAMIADVMDGRVARLSKTTSSFGGQLDSLSDAISFGVAPAFLMMRVVGVYLERWEPSPGLGAVLNQFVFLVAIVYVVCAVVRLARFNVENEEDESAHMNFSGLPSPAAAGVVVSLVIFQQDILPKLADHSVYLFTIIESATVWALPVVTLGAGLLMITRVRYAHVVNHYLRGKKSFSTFIVILFAGLLLVWYIQLAMVAGFCGFALSGLIRSAGAKMFRRKKAQSETAPAESQEKTGAQ